MFFGWFFVAGCLPSFLYAFFPVDRTFEVMDGIVSAAILGNNVRDGEVKYDKRTSLFIS